MKGGQISEIIDLDLIFFYTTEPGILIGVCRLFISTVYISNQVHAKMKISLFFNIYI